MKEYIEREAALEFQDKIEPDLFCKNLNGERVKSCSETFLASNLIRFIRSLPAADVRPVVRGEWIKYAPHNSDMMTCSECEKYWILDGDQYDYHFCPNCGADMRAEPKEER